MNHILRMRVYRNERADTDSVKDSLTMSIGSKNAVRTIREKEKTKRISQILALEKILKYFRIINKRRQRIFLKIKKYFIFLQRNRDFRSDNRRFACGDYRN